MKKNICLCVFFLSVLFAHSLHATPVSTEKFGNILISGIYDTPVELANGYYEGEPFSPGSAMRPRINIISEPSAIAEDKAETSFILLNENSGGTGQLLYLAAISMHHGKLINNGTLLIGDRISIISLTASEGTATLEYVMAAGDDAACCGTHLFKSIYTMDNGVLVERLKEQSGQLSVDTISGNEWHLTHFDLDEPVPDGVRITARFENGRISGSAGCNNYFASVSAESPSKLVIEGIGSTRKACPELQMKSEMRYLQALGNAGQFGFHAGKLMLSSTTGNEPQRLLFSAIKPPM